MSVDAGNPIVVEVLRFEDLPPGSLASRRAIVRWSDGTEGEAVRCYSDEVLVCEGDLIGKTQDAIRSLHFRRDRDWLQSSRATLARSRYAYAEALRQGGDLSGMRSALDELADATVVAVGEPAHNTIRTSQRLT